jgi:hypothetical protein
MLTELSLLVLFHRIFVTPTSRNATTITGMIVVLWWVGTVLADRNPEIPAHCGNKQLLAIIPPTPWIATDLALLLMPMPMVYKLHLPGLQRVGLAALFLLGGLHVPKSLLD